MSSKNPNDIIDYCLSPSCACANPDAIASGLEREMIYASNLALLFSPGRETERQAFLIAMLHGYGQPVERPEDVAKFTEYILSDSARELVLLAQAPGTVTKMNDLIDRQPVLKDLSAIGIPERTVSDRMLQSLRVTSAFARTVGGKEGRQYFRTGLRAIKSALRTGVDDGRARYALSAFVIGLSAVSGTGAGVLAVKTGALLMSSRIGQDFRHRLGKGIQEFLRGQGYEPGPLDVVVDWTNRGVDKALKNKYIRFGALGVFPFLSGVVDIAQTAEAASDLAGTAASKIAEAYGWLKTSVETHWDLAAGMVSSVSADLERAPSFSQWAMDAMGWDESADAAPAVRTERAAHLIETYATTPEGLLTPEQSAERISASFAGGVDYVGDGRHCLEEIAKAHVSAIHGVVTGQDIVGIMQACSDVTDAYAPLPEGQVIHIPPLDGPTAANSLESGGTVVELEPSLGDRSITLEQTTQSPASGQFRAP